VLIGDESSLFALFAGYVPGQYRNERLPKEQKGDGQGAQGRVVPLW
jgi:hypothetical protein